MNRRLLLCTRFQVAIGGRCCSDCQRSPRLPEDEASMAYALGVQDNFRNYKESSANGIVSE